MLLFLADEMLGKLARWLRMSGVDVYYKTQENFNYCPGCKRVYWEGTHVKKIRERLEELR